MTYAEALRSAKTIGSGNCSDAAAMAAFCESPLALLVGAVSPKLVWDGAMATGMTLRGLAALAASSPSAVADLMWVS